MLSLNSLCGLGASPNAKFTKLLIHGDSDITDASSFARTLTTSTVTVSTSSPKFGAGSLRFDSSTDSISMDYNGVLDIFADNGSPVTYDFWLQIGSAWSGYQRILGTGGYLMNGWELFHSVSHSCFAVQASLGDAWQFTGVDFTDTGAWHHIALERAGTTTTFYVDGVPGTQRTISSISTTNPFTIGYGGYYPVHTDMNIDEMRISGIIRWGGDFSSSLPSSAYNGD